MLKEKGTVGRILLSHIPSFAGGVKVVEYNPATDAFRVLPEGNPLEKELLYDEIAAAERQIANGEGVDGSAVFEELKRKPQA